MIQREEILIEPKGFIRNYWYNVWLYRELFLFLAWRDIILRFKQKLVGVIWSFARPVFYMVVLTIIFGHLAKLPSGGVPYALLVFAGILPWQFFTSVIGATTNCIVGQKNLVAKVYFPRIVLPMAGAIVCIIDFIIAFFIMALVMVWYQYSPPATMLTLPLFFLLGLGAAVGMGLWLAPLNARFRDVRDILPMVLQMGTYISPVGYSADLIPEKYRLLYSLNPMVGVIDGFRWAITDGAHTLYMPGLYISIVFTLVVLYTGFRFFRNSEKILADIL